MDVLPDGIVEHLQKTHRCKPEIQQVAQELAGLTPAHYDTLAVRLTEGGEDHALGILMDVAAVNKVKFDPVVLANALRVVEIIIDIKYPYDYQDESAIAPLLAVAVSEELSHERQAFAARLAVELAIKFSYPKQPVKKVLWELMEEIRSGGAGFMLDTALELLENENEAGKGRLRLLGSDVLSELPAERPAVVIGDGGTVRRPVEKLGRNEPCRCGSGKKYKKCCYSKDQITMRDASAYEGITMSQLRENPSLVDGASYIEGLRPYELKKLAPAKLNDEQLLVAYSRADTFGLRELAWGMLSELKGRPGKESLAVEHILDLFDSALRAQDVELVRTLAPHIPEEDRYLCPTDRLKHELLENPDKFRDLEAICKNTFAGDNKDHLLLELSYAFEDILPALSVVFGRAAIVSEPERQLDNELLLEVIHRGRIALDLEPWGDPIEDYWDWKVGKVSGQAAHRVKEEKIRKLQEQLSDAREKSTAALRDIQEKEQHLAGLEKKLQNLNPVAPGERTVQPAKREADRNGPMAGNNGEEKKQEITALRRKIEELKDEIRSQQESRRQLRKELQDAHEKISRQSNQKTPEEELCEKEPDCPLTLPEKVHIPEFTDSFKKSCEDLPSDLVKKAMQAAVGFASRDNAILRQTVGIERMPGHYRIRIGIHHRLIVRQAPGSGLQIVDVIPRKQLDTWIRQHAP